MEDALPLYHRPQDSSIPGKTVLPWRQVNILAICAGLNHEFTLSELVAVANSTELLHLRTFPSVEDTPPLTSRFFNTWKNSSLMNSSQHSGHLHWINSWIEIFWAHCSGKFTVWLSGHLFTHGRCSTTDYKAPRHLESRFCHEGKSTFWPFILDQTTNRVNRHFLSTLQWYMVLPDSNWTRFHLRKTLYHGQQGPSTLGKPVLLWTAVSILNISTGSSQVLHIFTAHCAIIGVFCVLILA